MPLFRCGGRSPLGLPLALLTLLPAAVPPASAQDAKPAEDGAAQRDAAQRESVEIEPYTGPAIFLPEGEAPPPPSEVESRVVKENFPGTETLRFERRVVRYSDDSVVSDGPHKEFYSSGELYVAGEYSKGKATGEWSYHHPNGKVAKTVLYVDGRPDGEVKLFSPEGVPVSLRKYKNGIRDGVWETYSEDGKTKLREDHYSGGKADGVFKVWYSNGQLQREVPFAAGKQEGVAREWSRTGEPRAEVTFKNGLKDGPAKLWQRDGRVIEQVYEGGKLVKSR